MPSDPPIRLRLASPRTVALFAASGLPSMPPAASAGPGGPRGRRWPG
eukprot:CAMPEP_0194726414 /NCGR_PEP_ID=MMETSP0296-20130528/31175_1 /TAXON_ID=39354 /ORGANISM="Heterosigma akashiwo, Strain CCMP2393" /LENGTH=46 /DNA_ID= /DNA_START= /DNA_END= /DNA_ORIENTATION=